MRKKKGTVKLTDNIKMDWTFKKRDGSNIVELKEDSVNFIEKDVKVEQTLGDMALIHWNIVAKIRDKLSTLKNADKKCDCVGTQASTQSNVLPYTIELVVFDKLPRVMSFCSTCGGHREI